MKGFRLIKKFFISILIVVTLASLAIFSYRLYQIEQIDRPIHPILFNNEVIDYASASITYSVISDIYTKEIHYQVDAEKAILTTHLIENSLIVDKGAIIDVVYEDGTHSNHVNFEKNGIYQINVNYEGLNEKYTYHFEVMVDIVPEIIIPKLNPVQGDILFFQINNLPTNSDVKIDSIFEPSKIYQKNNTANFYLAMWYAAEAKQYPLTITINERDYVYELNVLNYEFKELHFTVESSTVSSTIGNQDAVIQYREVIYPTYKSAVDEVFWAGNFIVPVVDARISSSFGDKRFVNDAKTPTRHVGIDYALACGSDVLASHAGKVIVSQFLIIVGNVVIIDHGLGLKTYYQHMQDLNVEEGDIVKQGQIIGHVGTTGYSSGCHLHFQSMVMGQSFNPEFLYTWMQ